MRLTEDQFKEIASKRNQKRPASVATDSGKSKSLPSAKGRAVRRHPGEMNKTEAAYAAHLDQRISAGEIAAYWFERLTLKLAADTRYTPDFMVQLPCGTIEIHEVKGFWEDDALVKIKVAASLFPFRFIAVSAIAKKAGGGWAIREF